MGNCALRNHSRTKSMNHRHSKSIKHVSTGVSKDASGQNSSIKIMLQSPISDQGDQGRNSDQTSPRFPSRIPVRSSPFRKSHLSKSTPFIRSSSHSRIPVVPARQKSEQDRLDPVPTQVILNSGLKHSQSQMNESGFVSDLSVTTSGHSQVTSGPRTIDEISGLDDIHTRVPSSQSNDNIEGYRSRLRQSNIAPSNCNQTALAHDRLDKSHHKALRKQLSDVSIRRPHSLSCESEMLAHRLSSKRLSEGISSVSNSYQDPSSPCLQLESSSILQDVSHLKLMLLKLRRSLLQEPADLSSQLDSLFRSPLTSLTGDIALLSREELEQKYEKMVVRNLQLEKLLECRDNVIAQMQSDRDLSDYSKNQICLSPLHESVTATHCKSTTGVDIPLGGAATKFQ